jgi:hypothetical protein
MTQSAWVPLREALWIAFYGDTKDDWQTRPGALLHGLKRTEIPATRREFDIALSKAALDGAVHFQGRRSADALPEPIPPASFVEPCGFSTDGSITPRPYSPIVSLRAHPADDGITWSKVIVNRIEFCEWLSTTFPKTAAHVGAARSSDKTTPSPDLGPEVRTLGNSKRKTFSKQELLKAWLQQKFDGQPVPDPQFECRKDLISRAIYEVPKLRGTCDEATMKKAIDNYNANIRNDPKQSDRNSSE